jgi:nucleotide-binding universal stress UspA family protein
MMLTIKNILCPVDFFPASERAADYAAGIAADYGARLKLLHVVSPVLSTYKFPLNPVEVVKTMKSTTARRLKKRLDRVRAAGVNATTEVRVGNPQDEIRHVVDADKPDIVVMGTHGRRGLERWFLGSVTESLLRHSPVPLLTVSPATARGERHFRRIVVTTDFSDGTADALAYAFSIAQEHQAHLDLLHVVHDVGIDISRRYRDPYLKNVRTKLENLIPGEAKDWCKVNTKIEAGVPYRVILSVIKQTKPDLLVMNIHGKGMLDRALLGTTAERVVRAANCPVLLIPPIGKTARKTGRKKRAA